MVFIVAMVTLLWQTELSTLSAVTCIIVCMIYMLIRTCTEDLRDIRLHHHWLNQLHLLAWSICHFNKLATRWSESPVSSIQMFFYALLL